MLIPYSYVLFFFTRPLMLYTYMICLQETQKEHNVHTALFHKRTVNRKSFNFTKPQHI